MTHKRGEPGDQREASMVHTDHPLRHWDRTCPACIAELRAECQHGHLRRKCEICERDDRIEQLERENAELIERCARIAEQHYIFGHSVAGWGFAKLCADKIRALDVSQDQSQDNASAK